MCQKKYNHDLIALNNLMGLMYQGIRENAITISSVDSLSRNLVHQCAIFGNLDMLKELVKLWGDAVLLIKDKFETTLTHFASRSGYLSILKYLEEKGALTFTKEARFNTTGLDLCFAMKHYECFNFLLPKAPQFALDSALINAVSEGNLELTKMIVSFGGNIHIIIEDVGSTLLDRACTILFAHCSFFIHH